MIRDVIDNHHPANRGVLTGAESTYIRKTLELGARTDIELQNVRDMSVMLYDIVLQSRQNDPKAVMETMDAMSGVTGVIDEEKSKRGLPV